MNKLQYNEMTIALHLIKSKSSSKKLKEGIDVLESLLFILEHKEDTKICHLLIREYCFSNVSYTTLSKVYNNEGGTGYLGLLKIYDNKEDAEHLRNKINAELKKLNRRDRLLKNQVLRRYNEINGNFQLRNNRNLGNNIFSSNELISVDRSQLEKLETIGVSAHEVHKFKGIGKDFSGLYYGKLFESTGTARRMEIMGAANEVIYSKMLRRLLKGGASDSAFLTKNGLIVGICSKGLNAFKPYAKILKCPDLREECKAVPGLLNIFIFSFIFLENDLHANNMGWSIINGEKRFAKIDHDYLCIRMHNAKYFREVQEKFRLDEVKAFLKTPCWRTLKALGNRARFGPFKINNYALRGAHWTRSKFTGKSVNTIGYNDKTFFKHTYIPNNYDELIKLPQMIRDIELDNFQSYINNYIVKMQSKVWSDTSSASQLADCIVGRLRQLQLHL
ncbi:MAG: hypothetical protein GY750_14210 [Lentisphaerae bacterium]|nr:hypothetical protein [Lentisphaerota bacterium]MCP4102554.1 hypothetical protein [Lentisphaerota bacterium]